MDLRQLSYFVAVAEEGQFTRAAARVSVAQPAVSAQIRRLELELGEALFHRDQRAVTLTAAGEALLPHARAALAAAERGRDTIASLRGLLHGSCASACQGRSTTALAETLGAFHRAHPAIEIALREQHNEPLLQAVAAGDIDAAVVGLSGQPLPPQVRTRVIAAEPLVLAVRPGDPLARRRSVTLAQLRDEPMITLTAWQRPARRAREGLPRRRLQPADHRGSRRGRLARRARRRRSRRRGPAALGDRRRRSRSSSRSAARACDAAPRSPGARTPRRPPGAPSSRSPASASPAERPAVVTRAVGTACPWRRPTCGR